MSGASICSRLLRLVCFVLAATPLAVAGGPRFVTGTTYGGTWPGHMMGFFTMQPLYYTDPGSLGSGITHAQSDAMVAAAASVWNVPMSLITLGQGGSLAEHVSGANSYFDGNEVVFPADVQASNFVSIPIAVIYDTDGSLTDLLLGSGASDPGGCRQNGVTESVDAFGQSGTINHAVILLNGRCVGTTPQQLVQMQYQLMRKFGRVLGLAWSQCNDSIFTGATPANALQEANWPVMHPLDVICGPYTYQCMQNPFVLRPDDTSTLALLYPVTAGNATAGKTASLSSSSLSIGSTLDFPTQQGMEMVNVVVYWSLWGVPNGNYEVVSGVTGARYQRNGGNPVTGGEAAADNAGGTDNDQEDLLMIGRIPLDYSEGRVNVIGFYTEDINPLYSGEYAIGTYEGTPVAMSGTTQYMGGWLPSGGFQWGFNWIAGDAAAGCSPGNDGVANAPVPADPSGWWSGLLCGPGHTSWWSASVKAGRSWTLETTATDETGTASGQKMRPVMGVWQASDPAGTLPTVAATPGAMNSFTVGMTQLAVASASQDTTMRMAIADQYGAGRPDFTYKARMLYADSILPAMVGAGGGRITITGTGFRQGNEVTVNGVRAVVISWTATQIVASAPSMASAKMALGVAADVAVIDPGTGGQTVMSGVLVYSGAVDVIQVVSAPAALATGVVATTPFAVRVFASDGVTAVGGATVRFAVVGGAALAVCGSAGSCLMTTDATGLAQSVVTGISVGVVVLSATEVSGGAVVSVTLNDADPVRVVTAVGVSRYLAAGAAVGWSVPVLATQDGVAAAGAVVVWSATAGLALGSLQGVTNVTGTASVAVQTVGLAGGTQGVVTGCAWTTVCAGSVVHGVAAPLWTIGVASGAGQTVGSAATLGPVVLLVSDGAGHPLIGAPVQVYQTVDAWEGACPVQGPCPAAPVLAAATSAGVSDANGMLTVTPLQVAGVPQVVNIAAATGTQGFVAVALVVHP